MCNVSYVFCFQIFSLSVFRKVLRPLTGGKFSVSQPSRHKDQLIYRESEDCSRPRSRAGPLRRFPDPSEAAHRGRFASLRSFGSAWSGRWFRRCKLAPGNILAKEPSVSFDSFTPGHSPPTSAVGPSARRLPSMSCSLPLTPDLRLWLLNNPRETNPRETRAS